MKNKNKYTLIGKVLAGFSLFASLLIAPSVQALGLGVVPGRIVNYELTRGSVYQETVYISRDDAKEALKGNVKIDIPGANSWISIDKGNAFDLKSGVQNTPVVIKVSVPNDAEYKDYKGTIDIIASPSALQGNVAIAPGVSLSVEFKVIEKKINSFVVQNIMAKESYQGEEINLMVGIKNTGNIPTAPTKAILDVYDSSRKNIIATKENLGSIERVDPFASKTVKVVFDSKEIPANNYWGKLKVYNGDEMVGDYDVGLTILPKEAKGLAAKSGSEGFLAQLFAGDVKAILSVVLLILALGVVVFAVKNSIKTKK